MDQFFERHKLTAQSHRILVQILVQIHSDKAWLGMLVCLSRFNLFLDLNFFQIISQKYIYFVCL